MSDKCSAVKVYLPLKNGAVEDARNENTQVKCTSSTSSTIFSTTAYIYSENCTVHSVLYNYSLCKIVRFF